METNSQDVENSIVIINDEGTILRANPVAERMFGYESGELLDVNVSQILPATDVGKKKHDNLIFEILSGCSDKIYKKGIRKNGSSFTVDIFLVPFHIEGKLLFDCVIKDDSSRFFHERLEALCNVILRRVLVGDGLDEVAPFIVEQLSMMFDSPMVWVGSYDKEEKGVWVLSSFGDLADNVAPNTLYTSVDLPIHPAVRACEKMEMVFDDVYDEEGATYRLMSFPFLSREKTYGVMTLLLPIEQVMHVTINRLDNVATRLGMISQIAEDQTFLRLLGTAMSSAMNAVLITDAKGKVIWINDAFTKLTGYDSSNILGRAVEILRSKSHSEPFYENLWRSICTGQSWEGEIINRRKDGSLLTCQETIVPIANQDNKVTHFVVTIDDLTAKKNAEGKLIHLSNYDQLTDLPNRSLFLEKLNQILSKHKDKPLAVLSVDLTAFNRFNDTMGHEIGDIILKAISERLMSCITSKDLVARVDGDEFGIILQGASSVDALSVHAHQIIKALEVPLLVNDTEVCLGSCIGISLYPTDADSADKLINYAEMALFKAKKAGSNTYFFFSQDMNQEMEERLIIERDMRKALLEKQFFLEYQPQLDLHTGRILGFEALVRWLHPEKGLILPNLFISVAEDTGMIEALSEYVMETAFSQIKKWNQMGFGNLTMAVNLSAAQFEGKNLFSTIKKLIAKKKVDPSFLELEITESLLMKHIKEASVLLNDLSKMGIKIAMDDFGTGYSSLSYLNQLPIDKLKIDKSFIQPMLDKKENEEIVKAIVNLGHTLNLSIIAEGCEDKQQYNALKKLGCDAIQGFYVARSLTSDKAEELIKKYNK